MRKAWTDERLDDMSRQMADGFNRIDADLHALQARVDGVHSRIDALQRTMLQTSAVTIAALIGLIATQL